MTQYLAAVLMNPLWLNLFRGRIYRGPLKRVCVPALNCYSCPAAWGACPLGSLQAAVISLKGYAVRAAGAASAASFVYVVGFVSLVGALGGRFACGWLCPFGLFQELVFKFKKRTQRVLPKWTRSVKYVLLAGIIVVPFVISYPSSPMFCKWICPAGTLEAGIPLVGYDTAAGGGAFEVGLLFAWKMLLTTVIIAVCLTISRFYCRVLCPLGAAWGLFNRASLVTIEVDRSSCNLCGFCKTVCPVDIYIYEDSGTPECVRCFACTKCPQGAVRIAVRGLAGRRRRDKVEGRDENKARCGA